MTVWMQVLSSSFRASPVEDFPSPEISSSHAGYSFASSPLPGKWSYETYFHSFKESQPLNTQLRLFSHTGDWLAQLSLEAVLDWYDKARKIILPSLLLQSKVAETLLLVLFTQLILLFMAHFGPQRYHSLIVSCLSICTHLCPLTQLPFLSVCIYVSLSPLSVELEDGEQSGTRTKQSLDLLFGWSCRGNR